MMSNIILFFTTEENANNIAITIAAPMNAAIITAKKPLTEISPAVILPPRSNITSATPRLAPLLIPKIDGPASGFLNAVCSNRPLTASAPPHKTAVMACGKRVCSMMYSHPA